MSFIYFIKDKLADIYNLLIANKLRSIILAICYVVAFILGIVISSGTFSNDSTMTIFVKRCCQGNIVGVIFTLVLWTLITYAVIIVYYTYCKVSFLPYLFAVLDAFRCGSNIYALVYFCGLWGVLFSLLILIVQLLGNYVALSISTSEKCCNNSFRESFCDTKPSATVLVVCLIIQIICIVLLRI